MPTLQAFYDMYDTYDKKIKQLELYVKCSESSQPSERQQHREMDLLCVYSQKRLKWIALGPD